MVRTTDGANVGKMIQVGFEPACVGIAHIGAYADVSNTQDNTVSVIAISPVQ